MKKVLCLVLTCMLVLSAFGTIAFASEDEIIITKGSEFKNLVKSANFGKTFIIEGTETLADGSTGIIIDQSSVSGFYGTLRGVDGKNNIQISKPLFSSIGQADTGDVVIDNIILKGSNEDGTGAVSYSDNAGALLVAAATNYPYAVTISNVTNYVDVTNTGSGKAAGGILGYVRYRDVTITNCVNYGDVDANTGTAAAGGIVGRFYGASSERANISHCVNYGDVESSGTAGGIVGRSGTIPGSVTYCANYGDVTCTGTTKNTTGAAGICYNSLPTSKCFNAGNVSSDTMAGGIMATGLSLVEITDCFNVGSISSTSADNYPAGIVGSYAATEAVVTNCYNLGTITGTSPLQIVNSKSGTTDEKCVNNYYVYDKTNEDDKIGTQKTLNNLAYSLPEGFSSDVWVYTEDAEYNYALPQLSGNLFTNEVNDTWFFEATEEITEVTVTTTPLVFSGVTDSDFVPTDSETGEEIAGGYSIVAARFALPEGVTVEDIEYGMLVSKRVSGEELTAATCTKEVKASKNFNGAYGILFYGNMVDGDTYYVRPYVKNGEEYTYGAPTSFVFDAE